MTKHKPATALPWHSEAPMGGIRAFDHLYLRHDSPYVNVRAEDSRYIAHSANAYPRLVETLRALCNAEHDYGEIDNVAVNQAWGPAMQLLRELGEIE